MVHGSRESARLPYFAPVFCLDDFVKYLRKAFEERGGVRCVRGCVGWGEPSRAFLANA
jgi:hypothetical protein